MERESKGEEKEEVGGWEELHKVRKEVTQRQGSLKKAAFHIKL